MALEWDDIVLHHGCCIGVDQQAHELALELEWVIVCHPPLDQSRSFDPLTVMPSAGRDGPFLDIRQPKPFLDRNQDIVDESLMLFGLPLYREYPRDFRGKGTWSTINRCVKADKLAVVILNDGEVCQGNLMRMEKFGA